jgi:hypothetical protein
VPTVTQQGLVALAAFSVSLPATAATAESQAQRQLLEPSRSQVALAAVVGPRQEMLGLVQQSRLRQGLADKQLPVAGRLVLVEHLLLLLLLAGTRHQRAAAAPAVL